MIRMDRSTAKLPGFDSRIYVWQIIQLLQLSTADDPNTLGLKQHHLPAQFCGQGIQAGLRKQVSAPRDVSKGPACGYIQLVTALGWQIQDGLTHRTRPS